MQRLELTLPTPAENLALDEALLDGVHRTGPVLRFWESSQAAVIVGRASRIREEVNEPACQRHAISVHRRCSGGATVLISPGCLMYSVVISTIDRPELNVIENAHRYVLSRIQESLRSCHVNATLAGSSDLLWQRKKFSGNSLRCKRNAILYHGTLLYDADIGRIEECLLMPPRQPDYRQQRPHRDFLVNLPSDAKTLVQSLTASWQAHQRLSDWPRAETEKLVRERYACESWNRQR